MFEANLYLDARRPEWAEEERLGFVKTAHFVGHGDKIAVHFDHGRRIVEALRARASRSADARNPIMKAPTYLDAIRAHESNDRKEDNPWRQ
jgi:hypothetical protein